MDCRRDVIAYRDRAIVRFFLYRGGRISTACRLRVSNLHRDGAEASIQLDEKGDHRMIIGLHFASAEAIADIPEALPTLRVGRSFGHAADKSRIARGK